MTSRDTATWLVAVAFVLGLAGCGSSSDNASPGAVVVVEEVVVDPDPGSGGGGSGGGGTGGGGGGTGTEVDTVIPDALNTAIVDSGTTTSAALGSKAIFTVDVAELAGGQLDPAGLTIGNDVVFQITGGALKVTPPATTTSTPGSGTFKSLLGASSVDIATNVETLPDCVLNVAPGAIIAGSSASDFLVIEQGCAIVAEGTADEPIIFTAQQELDGTVEASDRGLWGGLVINGRAPINDCPEGVSGGTMGCIKEGEANSGTFGGDQPNDNSGTLQYVSVRYAGSNVDPENQLNGIAFQGVGDQTVIEYVQVHNNLDDGIEFFGGTADAKYVVLTGNADDSLDWTDGWTGRIQYLYIEQSDSADNAIEADNREGNENLLPRSNPSIANMTVLGKSDERALRIRRGTGLDLFNSFIDGSERCIRVDGASRDLIGTDINVAGVSFACGTTHEGDSDGAVETYLNSAINVSQIGENVTPINIDDTFFTDEDFIGAFGSEDWSAGWTVPGSVSQPTQADFGCPEGTQTSVETVGGQRVCQLSGTITSDVLLTSNNLYQLIGKVTIGGENTDSATLTIQAGTTIYGASPETFLVISRGSQIIANGTRTAPVTLTAEDDVQGLADLENDRGLWGGLVINGNAPINDCPEGVTGGSADCTKEGEANSGTFGGDDPEDSSGKLNYLVVKFAGSNVDPENQLNGIAFQGVGSDTEVDFVQVHNNLDDGIEFFGGTVNAKHVVLTGNADDSLDWTDGWQGSIQFIVIDQDPASGDSAIEADNREGAEDLLPRSLPTIANMTINGIEGSSGARLRRGTGLELYNSVISGSDDCLRIQGSSINQLGTGIQFGGVSLDCGSPLRADSPEDEAAVQAELDASENISTSGAAVPAVALEGDFFDAAPFVGAVESADEDWTAGWTVAMPDSSVSLGCPAGAAEIASLDGSTTTCQLSGTYTSDLALARGNFYVLDGKVVIGGDNINPATLGIESGVTIVGDDPEDFLVISRGSQIMARGTVNMPITLTGDRDVLGTLPNADTARGEWGGLVINGNAPINDCPEGETGGTVGCTKEGEAASGLFGGANPEDTSGMLRYVVVKYAGSNVDPENQLNGIAFQGVGSGTSVDFIQVFNNLDDGVEFFGGTVSASHVVLVGNADDSLDWTDGWTGNLQFVHILQTDDGDSGIEADNREGNENLLPRSKPVIANMSIIDEGNDKRGIRLRRGTGLNLYNSEVTGHANCLLVGGESLNLLGSDITFDGVTLDCATVNEDANTAVQSFLDGSATVTQDGTAAPAVTLPAQFDGSGDSLVGSGVEDWGDGWTVGLP
ncbi:MAG: hypothetical protein AAGG11_01545 [Pseudomonadota bacterium]